MYRAINIFKDWITNYIFLSIKLFVKVIKGLFYFQFVIRKEGIIPQ